MEPFPSVDYSTVGRQADSKEINECRKLGEGCQGWIPTLGQRGQWEQGCILDAS